MDFETRVGAYGVVLSEGHVLASLWGGPAEPVWTLPGGGMELGESPEQSCLREIQEETGYTAELGELLGVMSRTIPAAERISGGTHGLLMVQIVYRAEVTGGTLTAEIGGSSIDAAWLPLDSLHTLRVSASVYRALELAGERTA